MTSTLRRFDLQKLVLASFPSASDPSTPSHIPLLTSSFQSLFPPLAPNKISLSSARRVVLLSYNAEKGTIELRHYLISVRAAGVSRRVRKILEGGSATKPGASKASSIAGGSSVRGGSGLNSGNVKDVADYLLRTGPTNDGYETATSGASSAGEEDEQTSVRLASDYTGRNNRKGEKRAVRLDEIGPRLELRLVKITEGIPGKEGAVLYHEFGAFYLFLCLFGSIFSIFFSLLCLNTDSFDSFSTLLFRLPSCLNHSPRRYP